ncbi:outer membrane lipoprotein carrier protein LolA [Aquamicrobium sp. LC103]|uniref:outer membrane lipoprotein carrier protein LolA n=1 Tax=Aquamicrobium sp. LC103 TaxID=1120658 RepID=UPI0009E29AF0|nr:outer membrane lipoprotein carrier protein LolA [Aquamicrobium sp. LC103]TKT82921.1 outer membrane lipoprotein carrier protein LolA [Aquamicrobium sp. LC103]
MDKKRIEGKTKPGARTERSGITRRGFLGATAAFAALAAAGNVHKPFSFLGEAQAQADVAQRIAQHFSSVKTMMGEFVQFGPRGEQTGGKFYIQRPGKIRFNYEAPSTFKVTSDGRSVVLENTRLKTADVYPLAQTPLKLLLDERIDLSGNKVRGVKQENDLTTIQLADRSMFGNATITMMFDPKSYDLRQWTITDAQGKETTVMIFNVQQGVTFDPSVFRIDESNINHWNRQQQGR